MHFITGNKTSDKYQNVLKNFTIRKAKLIRLQGLFWMNKKIKHENGAHVAHNNIMIHAIYHAVRISLTYQWNFS